MAKRKVGFTGIKKCRSVDLYRFKNGSAVVGGFRIGGRRVLITLGEFNELMED